MADDEAKRTILMVDDEASARKMASLLLEREGYRCCCARGLTAESSRARPGTSSRPSMCQCSMCR